MKSENTRGEPGDLRLYWLFGRVFETDSSFDHLLAPAKGVPEFRYRLSKSAEPQDWRSGSLVYESAMPDSKGCPRLKIWRKGELLRVFFSEVGAFHLEDRSITGYPDPQAAAEALENLLLGAVSAFWMELRGLPALHASAVAVGGRAIAFASHSGGGKSALAALFLQAGSKLLTDDLLPLDLAGGKPRAWPGYPHMRLWPQEARRFVGSVEGLQKVHPQREKLRIPLHGDRFGGFCSQPLPLSRIYLPSWLPQGSRRLGVQVQPLSPADALIELVRFSFASLVAEALGLQERRFHLFAEVARLVPMRRLLYAKGFDHLSAVRAAIEDDLKAEAGLLRSSDRKEEME